MGSEDTGKGTTPALMKRALAVIDRQWPGVKFCSLGFYSAWILTVMNGSGVVILPEGIEAGAANSLLYLFSGIPLTLVLIACGLLCKRVGPCIERGPLVPVACLVASVCTFIVLGGPGFGAGSIWFAAAAVGTGLTTPLLCLRIGLMYSTLPSNRVLFTTFASGLLANLLYFTCCAISRPFSILLISCFPTFAVILALLRPAKDEGQDELDTVPIDMLPRGFFGRCIAFVTVYAIVIGIVRGLSTQSTEIGLIRDTATMSIFVTFVVTAILIAAFAFVIGIRKLDLSKLYYPLIVITAVGLLLSPILGRSFGWLQLIVTSVTYNIFILTLWCYFANIAGQTDMSPVRVFGLGRGASAFGTTVGQFAIWLLSGVVPGLEGYSVEVGVVAAIVVLVMAMVVFDERTIGDALEKTFREETAHVGADPAVPSAAEEHQRAHDRIVEEYQLTPRESEVIELLARGRTTSYISEELGISYNTVKGHVRNIYAKCGVHSRQELIDLVDSLLS